MEEKPKIPRKPGARVVVISDNATLDKAITDKLREAGANIVSNPFQSLDQKREQINAILDKAEKDLQSLGCKYFLAAIDRDPRDTEGGKVLVNSEHDGADMAVIMQHAFPANKDLVYLGVALGAEISRRNKEANIKFRENKRKVSKATKGGTSKNKNNLTCATCGAPGTMTDEYCKKCGAIG